MNTNYALETYRSHDLNIAMRTSSGDLITMDFSNEQSASLQLSENKRGSQASMRFSSMQSFQFSIESNGIDAQDKKEIDAFMKIAKPFIDNFLEELSTDAPKTPVTTLAHTIAAIFDPTKERSEDEKNSIKSNIVKMFDNSFQAYKPSQQVTPEEMLEKIFKNTKNLLEKTLKEFDNFNKELYV